MERILDFTVLYNTADSSSQRNSDTEISLRFVEKLVKNAKSWGLVNSWYSDHDCMPGTDIFEDLDISIRSAKTIVIVVTNGFLQNQWGMFSTKTAFKSLLDLGQSGFVVPILLGTDEGELPTFLKINHKNVYFSLDGNEGWIEEERMWHKIRTLITSGARFPPNAGKRGIQETQVPAGNTTDDDNGSGSARQSNANWTRLGTGQTHRKQPQEHANTSSDINDPQLQLAIEMSLREMEKKAETPDDLEYDHPNENENDAVNIYKKIDYTDLEGINIRELLHAVTSGIRLAFNWFT